jgi:hypothetical protein
MIPDDASPFHPFLSIKNVFSIIHIVLPFIWGVPGTFAGQLRTHDADQACSLPSIVFSPFDLLAIISGQRSLHFPNTQICNLFLAFFRQQSQGCVALDRHY